MKSFETFQSGVLEFLEASYRVLWCLYSQALSIVFPFPLDGPGVTVFPEGNISVCVTPKMRNRRMRAVVNNAESAHKISSKTTFMLHHQP